jgi:hypothetical protein
MVTAASKQLDGCDYECHTLRIQTFAGRMATKSSQLMRCLRPVLSFMLEGTRTLSAVEARMFRFVPNNGTPQMSVGDFHTLVSVVQR